MSKQNTDYSVYLVTDSSLVPKSSTLLFQVEQAIKGGATIVQLREKNAETKDFIEIGKKIHQLTKEAGIPLIINDRLDVVLALDAEGIHVGQDDIDIKTIRKYLGPEKIIGLSVSDEEEARRAVEDDVDYVGIGAVFGTLTKNLKKNPIGTAGVRNILDVINKDSDKIKSVAIGGINQSNTELVLKESSVKYKLDGVAVVSCIIADHDALSATKKLKQIVDSSLNFIDQSFNDDVVKKLLEYAPKAVAKVATVSPFVHHMTNTVVTNISANVTIAVGASPAMSECVEEFEDFAKFPNGSLLINMGTATEEGVNKFIAGIKAYNGENRPVVLDPVGAGASTHRRNVVKKLLNAGTFAAIKGNEGEITSTAEVEGAQVRGVDSVGGVSIEKRFEIVSKLSRENNNTTVLMTGVEDVLVNESVGEKLLFRNGHEYLGKITGSGCVLGSLVTAFNAITGGKDSFYSTASALLLYTIAAERAANKSSVNGPGTFVPALLDELYLISKESVEGNHSWINRAKVERY